MIYKLDSLVFAQLDCSDTKAGKGCIMVRQFSFKNTREAFNSKIHIIVVNTSWRKIFFFLVGIIFKHVKLLTIKISKVIHNSRIIIRTWIKI